MNRGIHRSAAALAAPAPPPFTLLSEEPDYETPFLPAATGSPSPKT